jgi:glutaconate CoA-transferase subunit A
MPVPGHVGSDYERLRPEFKVVEDPYEPGRRVMLVPAVRCDVALVHALLATGDGMLLLDPAEDDVLLAQASRVVIASAERLVTRDELLQRAGEGAVLPAIHVTGVVAAPLGGHPTRVRGAYDVDDRHLRDYVAAAGDDRRFKDYLARYVFGPRSHDEYLALIRGRA